MDRDTIKYVLVRLRELCNSWLELMDELNPDDLDEELAVLIAEAGVKIAQVAQKSVEVSKRNET